MLTRLRIEGGHTEITLAGIRYVPDETGAFEVPQEYAPELIRVHGGKLDPGINALELMVEEIEKDLASLKNHVEVKAKELTAARERLDAYKSSLKKPEPKPDPNPQRQQNNGNQQGRR